MEFKDIYNKKAQYDRIINSEFEDIEIKKNREIIKKYLEDAELGKTIKKGQHKKLGITRLYNSYSELKMLSKHMGKPFNKVSQKDFENYIRDLERGKIRSQPRIMKHVRDFRYKKGVEILTNIKGGKELSPETIAGKKNYAVKFFRYMFPKIDVSFVDSTVAPKEKPHLTRKELEKLRDSCSDFQLKVALQLNFDTGDRFGEWSRYKRKDIVEEEFEKTGDKYYLCDITLPDTARKKHKRTNATLLPETTKLLREYLGSLPEDQEYIFTYTYETWKAKIKRLTRKVLERNDISWHIIRHSSATYWAKEIAVWKDFCDKFAWSPNSRAALRYVHSSKDKQIKLAENSIKKDYSLIKDENESLKIQMRQLHEKQTTEFSELSSKIETLQNVLIDFDKFKKSKEYTKTMDDLKKHNHKNMTRIGS
jgi:integrase